MHWPLVPVGGRVVGLAQAETGDYFVSHPRCVLWASSAAFESPGRWPFRWPRDRGPRGLRVLARIEDWERCDGPGRTWCALILDREIPRVDLPWVVTVRRSLRGDEQLFYAGGGRVLWEWLGGRDGRPRLYLSDPTGAGIGDMVFDARGWPGAV